MMGLFLNRNIDTDSGEVGVQKAMGDYVYKFWHLLDETLNAILFILIGLAIIPIFQNFNSTYLIISILTILIVVISRSIGVFVPIKFLSFFKTFEKGTAFIISWGGLRGGLSIALALNLPDESEQEFMQFAYSRGYTVEDFIDPELTMTVAQDFKANQDAPELERLRGITQKRQAFTGNSSGTPAVSNQAPASTPDQTFIDAAAAKVMASRGGRY